MEEENKNVNYKVVCWYRRRKEVISLSLSLRRDLLLRLLKGLRRKKFRIHKLIF